jgi:hypothetical protein
LYARDKPGIESNRYAGNGMEKKLLEVAGILICLSLPQEIENGM